MRVANECNLLIYNIVQRPAKPSMPVRFRPRLQDFFYLRILALRLPSISSFSRQRPAWSSTRVLTNRKRPREQGTANANCTLASPRPPRFPAKKRTFRSARNGPRDPPSLTLSSHWAFLKAVALRRFSIQASGTNSPINSRLASRHRTKPRGQVLLGRSVTNHATRYAPARGSAAEPRFRPMPLQDPAGRKSV